MNATLKHGQWFTENKSGDRKRNIERALVHFVYVTFSLLFPFLLRKQVSSGFRRMLLKLGTGNGERRTGNGERGTGNGERGTGNGERGTGNGERGTGNGERGTGNGERGTGNGSLGTSVQR